MLTITGQVVGLESGAQYTDKTQRAKIRFQTAEHTWETITIRNEPGFKLDQQVELEFSAK